MVDTDDVTYGEFKEKVQDAQPRYLKVNLSDIEIPSLDQVKIQGNRLPLKSEAIRDLHEKVLSMPEKFSHHISNVMGEKARLNLLNALRRAMDENGGKPVKAIVSPLHDSVVGFSTENTHISAEGFFNVAERLIDRYDHVELASYSSNSFNDMVRVSMSTNRQLDLTRYGLQDEVFDTGATIVLKDGSIQVLPRITRITCTNQLTASPDADEGEFSLPRVTKEKVVTLFENLDEFADRGFVPRSIPQRIERATEVHASVSEVERARERIENLNVYNGTNPLTEELIPFAQIKKEYREMEDCPDIEDMSITQKKNAITPHKVWDVVNGMTRFASHDYSDEGFEEIEHEKAGIQRDAGRLLQKKTLDCENIIPSPFRMN